MDQPSPASGFFDRLRQPSIPENADRHSAVAELGRALHDLVQASVTTGADADELRRLAAMVRSAIAPLTAAAPPEPASDIADPFSRMRMYNPVIGPGSPIAPPLVVTHADGEIEATCTLGPAYEGPPRHTHGGVSAMLLDQLLGHAIGAGGRPGMTRDLVLRYRRPVPLQTPLHLTAAVVDRPEDGRTIVASATLATAADPATVLVEATGTFVLLREDHARVLFADARTE